MTIALQRKYILISIVLVGALSGVVLAFWSTNSFAEANTPEPNELNLAMSVNLFLKIEGEVSGDIQGDVTEAGKEGWIECISYQHSVVSPRDASSGLPTGKRQHKPFTITKQIDKASPLLYQALANNENLLNVSLYFYSEAELSNVHYFTIRLENAHIASVQTYRGMPPDPLDMPPDPLEQITFVYQKITWIHELQGLESSDTWLAADT